MYDNYGYLIHSAKGSTWSKKDHKYVKKYKNNSGNWVYIYKVNGKKVDFELDSKDRGIRGLKGELNKFEEEELNNYASRLKTMDINSDGKYLSNDEHRKITKPIGWNYYDVKSNNRNKDDLLKELPNGGVNIFGAVGNDSHSSWNTDKTRKDNQKALAKGIKKLKNKK